MRQGNDWWTDLPPFSAETKAALARVETGLRTDRDLGIAVDSAIAQLDGLDPVLVSRADAQFPRLAALHGRPLPSAFLGIHASPAVASGFLKRGIAQVLQRLPGRMRQPSRQPIFASTAETDRTTSTTLDRTRLATVRGLDHLFLFHRDGSLRGAALDQIGPCRPSPFFLAAVLWRLEDHVASVRDAATKCLERSLPTLDPAHVAVTVLHLLARQVKWKRLHGGHVVPGIVFQRADIMRLIVERMSRQTTGPQAGILHRLLALPELDPHLAFLSSKAKQPALRALALRTLIDGEARWPIGVGTLPGHYASETDRTRTLYATRPLAITVEPLPLIETALRNRSAMVRRAALEGMSGRLRNTPEARWLASALLDDPFPSVRLRAAFILRSSGTAAGGAG